MRAAGRRYATRRSGFGLPRLGAARAARLSQSFCTCCDQLGSQSSGGAVSELAPCPLADAEGLSYVLAAISSHVATFPRTGDDRKRGDPLGHCRPPAAYPAQAAVWPAAPERPRGKPAGGLLGRGFADPICSVSRPELPASKLGIPPDRTGSNLNSSI